MKSRRADIAGLGTDGMYNTRLESDEQDIGGQVASS